MLQARIARNLEKEVKRRENQQRLQELREQRLSVKRKLQELTSRPLAGRKEEVRVLNDLQCIA